MVKLNKIFSAGLQICIYFWDIYDKFDKIRRIQVFFEHKFVVIEVHLWFELFVGFVFEEIIVGFYNNWLIFWRKIVFILRLFILGLQNLTCSIILGSRLVFIGFVLFDFGFPFTLESLLFVFTDFSFLFLFLNFQGVNSFVLSCLRIRSFGLRGRWFVFFWNQLDRSGFLSC
jgi:hypothetical protein